MTKSAQSPSRAKLPNGARTEPQCCPTCGHPIVSDDGMNLTQIQRRIFEVIERHGQASEEIIHAAIWGSDPNGGPGLSVIKQHICNINKRIRFRNIAIRKKTGRYMTPYRFVSLLHASTSAQQEAAE